MLFSSTTFIFLYLPIVILVYYCLKWSRLLQNVFLLAASLVFYAWGEPKFVLVMMTSIVVNWLAGLLIDRKKGKKEDKKADKNTAAKEDGKGYRKSTVKVILILDVVFNLALLFVFKYLNFTGDLFGKLTGIDLAIPRIALPIGISFFTFQAMSYVIDVYRGKGEVQTNLLYVGLYISFFPQLIAGPIVRYETIADQIRNRKETANDFFDGFARFVAGLSKKVLLANSFAVLADQAFNTVHAGGSISVLLSWLGAVAYALQIFFDFSGYSDMAIGLGRMFGFHFLENFDYPYISTSITEFWRRWHISLGTWFRDYVYFPLGGSRCSKWRNVLNLLVVWSLTGLWHGANLTFWIWGLMYFVLLVIEKLTGIHKKTGKALKVFRWLYTMLFVLVGWIIFRSESLSEAFTYLKSGVGLNGNVFADGVFAGWFVQNLVLLVIGGVLCTPLFRIVGERIKDRPVFGLLRALGLAVLLLLSIASLVSNMYNPFIYFNF